MLDTETKTTQVVDLSCSFIDVCYPDDLQDHHNRENEILLAASVYNGISALALTIELLNSLAGCASDFPWGIFSEDAIIDVIAAEIDSLADSEGNLDLGFDEPSEDCYAYAYLAW